MLPTVALGIGLALSSTGVAVAQSSDTIVMSGLHNPRGLTFGAADRRDRFEDGPHAALYVAEAGTGGDLRCATIRGPVCVGLTGSISRYWHGRQQLVAQGLPSYAPFAPPSAGAVGPSDVSFAGGRGYVLIGLAANPDVRAQLAEHFGWIARFRSNGRVTYTVDVSAHETQANPDGGLVESNPNGLLATQAHASSPTPQPTACSPWIASDRSQRSPYSPRVPRAAPPTPSPPRSRVGRTARSTSVS
ncbi:ScyD/ScyE family protein [Solirubrobacter ginsenosidimutans]|uniref:ScyD/ScyE family protein n=1 Tax=Solirubrobacter ginsenosidimutans TaxID=490573 RepID=A0A9X3S5X2_9ACTN|nr:ScyD/ScyE family protein [Solirubrobacter ginsenosidimutans]MDA0166052.1 ScyD/ScyE family protein [Solirubrobacter ginsenosidimutans]